MRGAGPGRLGLVAAAALLASLGGLRAQESDPGARAQEGRLEVWAGEEIVHWTEDGRDAIFLTGQVRVRRGDIEMTAARALAWIRQGGLEEVYAEGNVVLRQGTQRMRAERLYFNFARNRAYIVDLRLQGTSQTLRNQIFYVTAREARMTAEGVIEAEDISITTCNYGIPHYHLSIDEARLVGRERYEPRKGRPVIWPYRSWQVQIEDVYPELMGAPIFFIPGLILGPWVKDIPVRSVQYGRSSRFGHYVLTEFGLKVKAQGEDGKPRVWGEVSAEADWRQKRGGAGGLDLRYGWEGYQGFLDTYFLHDQGRDLDVSFDQRLEAEDPLRREERGRAHFFHRHDLGPHWRYELEAHYLSDRSVREEFFEREFKESKDPETAAYVRWLDGFWGGYVYELHRLNDFQTQNEYLPRADFSLLNYPLFEGTLDNLYWTQRLDVAHLRRRFDEDLDLESARVWRFDAVTELSMPWDLGPVQLSPFARNRLTVYEDDLEGETEGRVLWTAGGRLVTQAHATYADWAWRAVGLRGLRAVAEAELRYARTFDTNVSPSELFPFEEVERLDEFEEVALEVRQRLLTKDEAGKPFEFFEGVLSVEYYPEARRDTTFANANTLEFPFSWIGLAPGPGGVFERRHVSNLHYEAAFRPRSFLWLRAAGEYNPETRHEEVRELSAGGAPFAGLALSVRQTFLRGVTDAVGAEVSWSLTPKWSVSGAIQYDFKIDEYLSQRLTVARDYHDFLLQAVVERDFGRDDRRFYVTVVPKFAATARRAGEPGRP